MNRAWHLRRRRIRYRSSLVQEQALGHIATLLEKRCHASARRL